MIRSLKTFLTRQRFSRLTAPYDRALAEARAKHKPTRAIIEGKRAAVHNALVRVVGR